MATVKMSGGKVVTKAGKVSCTCCAVCCMYPWPDPNGISGGPLYPDTDLPGTLVVTGLTIISANDGDGTYTKSGYTFIGPSFSHAGDTYQCVIIPSDPDYPEDRWRVGAYISPAGIFNPVDFSFCLVDSPYAFAIVTVEDQFPNTLLVNGIDTLTRDPETNLCCWYDLPTWTLCYNSSTYKFKLNGVAKDDPQDSPLGFYGTDEVA